MYPYKNFWPGYQWLKNKFVDASLFKYLIFEIFETKILWKLPTQP